MSRITVTTVAVNRWALIAAAGTAALLLVVPHVASAGPPADAPRTDRMAYAGGEGMGIGAWGMHPRMFERMAGELGLSEAQRQSIRGLFESARPAMEQRREQMRANAELMRRTQPGDRDYQAVVERVSRSAGELASRAVSDAAQLRAQVWAVLTPEQRSKLQQLQEQRRSLREERRRRLQERMDLRRGGEGAPAGVTPSERG